MFSFEHRQLIESNYHPLIGTGRLLKKDHSSSRLVLQERGRFDTNSSSDITQKIRSLQVPYFLE